MHTESGAPCGKRDFRREAHAFVNLSWQETGAPSWRTWGNEAVLRGERLVEEVPLSR